MPPIASIIFAVIGLIMLCCAAVFWGMTAYRNRLLAAAGIPKGEARQHLRDAAKTAELLRDPANRTTAADFAAYTLSALPDHEAATVTVMQIGDGEGFALMWKDDSREVAFVTTAAKWTITVDRQATITDPEDVATGSTADIDAAAVALIKTILSR